jgi:pimeloyl-ACP methyl ester carboxylesterase
VSIVERENDVQVGELRLRVRIYGEDQKPPVIMLHGGALMGSTWRRACERLTGYRCIAPDMRGHGESDWSASADYLLPDFASDLVALIEAFQLDRPHLVGMSLGGQTALHAVCHGLAVRSLCLVDVGPSLAPRGARAINEFVERVEYKNFGEALEAAAAFSPHRTRDSLAASLRRSMRETPQGKWAWKWDPARLATRRRRSEEAWLLWGLLDRVRCPALIVRGEDSPLFTADLAERFAAALPDARVEAVRNAGHTVQTDQPERLAGLLEEFWRGVDDAAATYQGA